MTGTCRITPRGKEEEEQEERGVRGGREEGGGGVSPGGEFTYIQVGSSVKPILIHHAERRGNRWREEGGGVQVEWCSPKKKRVDDVTAKSK